MFANFNLIYFPLRLNGIIFDGSFGINGGFRETGVTSNIMKTIQVILTAFTFLTFLLYNKIGYSKNERVESDIHISNITTIFSQPKFQGLKFVLKKNPKDTITKIKFQEFSLSINRLRIYDKDGKIDQTQKDSVYIHAELGETIEGQIISISSNQLSNLIIEQRYETSVTIDDGGGAHCDFYDWKHYCSDWKKLKKNNNGQFICNKYTKKDWEQFPKINIADLIKIVKEQCPEKFQIIDKIKSPQEYPSYVRVSRYFLKITGKQKDNGQIVTKVIIIEVPMGC
jgi:hypothetical protein